MGVLYEEEKNRKKNKSGQIPAFGNWDYANELPITQYFESARQAGLIRFSYSSASDSKEHSEAHQYALHCRNYSNRQPPPNKMPCKQPAKVENLVTIPKRVPPVVQPEARLVMGTSRTPTSKTTTPNRGLIPVPNPVEERNEIFDEEGFELDNKTKKKLKKIARGKKKDGNNNESFDISQAKEYKRQSLKQDEKSNKGDYLTEHPRQSKLANNNNRGGATRVPHRQQKKNTSNIINVKAVDEDLYKIPPELLHSSKQKKKVGFFSRCLVPTCMV